MDDGYFPRRHSIAHRVHREKAVGLLYGQRALCKMVAATERSRIARGRPTPQLQT
jgi:hypothetical protein